MKYDGSTWSYVGAQEFTSSSVNSPTLKLDSSDIPYVAFSDGANSSKATVMKYNGSSWVNVGSAGFSAGSVTSTYINFDNSDVPYIAFSDGGNSFKATVMKYNGSSWVNVGSAGFSSTYGNNIMIEFNSSNEPHVVFRGNIDFPIDSLLSDIIVMKYNGSSWVSVGSEFFSGDGTNNKIFPTLVFDSNDVPYVAFSDGDYGEKATLMKYNGSSWVNVGSPGFSAGAVANYNNLGLAFDSNDNLYLAFIDYANSQKATVMKYDGASWTISGTAGISGGSVSNIGFFVDPSDVPYIAFDDNANSGKTTVMKYYTPSSLKVASTFSINGNSATINNTSYTINLSLSCGATVNSLSPTISISSAATVSPASGVAQDFTNAVIYTVTAEDLTTQNYTATITTSACPTSTSSTSASARAQNLINMGKVQEAVQILNEFPTQIQDVNLNTNINTTTPKPANTPTVRKGNRNNTVKYIQEYLKIKADGIFGPITQKAVIEFQKKHNLVPDGIVGPRTWNKLI
jgi:hypothetical protein